MSGAFFTITKLIRPPRMFPHFSAAFAAARIERAPIVAQIDGDIWTVKPNGDAEFLAKGPIQ